MIDENRIESQDLNQQASLLLKNGNVNAAKEKLDRAIELDPMLMDSYKNYGDLYMSLEKYQDAKNSYKKALLIEKQGLLYFLYGNACFMNNELHEGLENYNLAISNNYDNDEMMFFMGMAYEHLNDDSMALRYFQKACLKNSSRPDYLIKKINVLVRLNMMGEAYENTEKLLENSPEMFDGYHIKTHLLIKDNNFSEALTFSKAAYDRFPEDVELFFDYVKCIVLNKDLDKALKEIEVAKQMKYFVDAKRNFTLLEAQILAEKTNIDKAIEKCNECVQLEENYFDGETRFMLMNLHLVKADYENALIQASAIVDKDLEDSFYFAALYYRPLCNQKLGNFEIARKMYKEANSIYRLKTLKEPGAIDIYLYRAMCLKDLEEFDKSLELLEFISNLGYDIPEIHSIRSNIYDLQGKKGLAEVELQKFYSLKPEMNPKQ